MMVKRLMLLVMLSAMFLACATTPQIREGRPEGEDLKEAVTKYWTYRVEQDLGKAYYYEHVSYTKLAEREFYMGGFGGSRVIIRNFKILAIGEEGSGTEGYTPVTLDIGLSWPGAPFPFPKIFQNEVRDLWIKKEGRWYHIQQQVTGLY